MVLDTHACLLIGPSDIIKGRFGVAVDQGFYFEFDHSIPNSGSQFHFTRLIFASTIK